MHTPVTPISRIHSEGVRDINRFRLALWGALLCIALGARGAHAVNLDAGCCQYIPPLQR